jgi:hypothetical protein
MSEEEKVTVQIQVPRPLHAFAEKIAALEGTKATDFYEEWVQMEFEANFREVEAIGLDLDSVKKYNNLEQYIDPPDC